MQRHGEQVLSQGFALDGFPAMPALVSGGELDELLKRTESGRELILSDHVRQLNTREGRLRKSEGLEAEHQPDPALDEAMILLD